MGVIKVKINKDKVEFSKGKGKLTQPIEPKYQEPPHRVCSICKDDGGCKNNEFHKDYEKNNEDVWGVGTDYYDCIDYTERRDGTTGQFMMNWMKNLQKNKDKNKCEGGFKEWSKKHK